MRKAKTANRPKTTAMPTIAMVPLPMLLSPPELLAAAVLV
jgi:hypothetical protein